MTTVNVKKVGGSLMLLLPQQEAEWFNIREGDQVKYTIEEVKRSEELKRSNKDVE